MCLYSNNFLFIDIYYKIALDKLGGASKQDVYALPIISEEVASTMLTAFSSIQPTIRACLFIIKEAESLLFCFYFMFLTQEHTALFLQIRFTGK